MFLNDGYVKFMYNNSHCSSLSIKQNFNKKLCTQFVYKKQNKTKQKNPTKKTHTRIKGYRVISPHDKIHP